MNYDEIVQNEVSDIIASEPMSDAERALVIAEFKKAGLL